VGFKRSTSSQIGLEDLEGSASGGGRWPTPRADRFPPSIRQRHETRMFGHRPLSGILPRRSGVCEGPGTCGGTMMTRLSEAAPRINQTVAMRAATAGSESSASQRHMAESNSHLLHRRCFARTAHRSCRSWCVAKHPGRYDMTCRMTVC
jgi:hypothetical protein